MNSVHRRPAAVVAGLVVLALTPGCANDEPARPEPTSTAPAPDAVDTTALVELAERTWADLPDSAAAPSAAAYRVPLSDGSGFVVAGSTAYDGGRPDVSLGAALFLFDDRQYFDLPDLPVEAGLGTDASAARVDDTIVLVGVDCPVVTPVSYFGVELCATEGGASAKVVLIHEAGADTWTRVEISKWLRDYSAGSPTVVGVRRGRVLLATGAASPVLAMLDPADGSIERFGEPVPVPAPGAEGVATPCVVDNEVMVVRHGPPVGTASTRVFSAPAYSIWWWRDGVWAALDPPAGVAGFSCAKRGLFVWRDHNVSAPDGSVDIDFYDPRSSTSTRLATDVPRPGPTTATWGDALLLPPPFSVDRAALARRVVVTPLGTVDLTLDPDPTNPGADPVVTVTMIGDVLLEQWSSRIYRMGLDAG